MTRRATRYLAILVTAATAALGAPAMTQAADLGGKVPVPVPEPFESASSTWDGWYLGGHLGGAADGDNDVVGGLQLGHNRQNGNIVYGAEGDLSFGDDTTGSIRARLGFARQSWLVYGTAGLAIGDDDTGLAAGGGIEYKVADSASIGAEALYYDLDDNFTVIRARLTWHFGGSHF